uniref:arginyltransferase n=1 Tax=Moniliophthora roreri TaxID=221103 RepID=A0A0W0FCF3_MONRR
MSRQVYQQMIDRGWRRSGTWCYKPNLKASCCPQYPIRLDAKSFKPSRGQRKLIHRWNRFVEHGKGEERKQLDKQKGKNNPSFNLVESIHASEESFGSHEGWQRHFEVKLEPSSYTSEKYKLFEKYQSNIHKDSSSPRGFKRFLQEPIPYGHPPPSHLPTHYGSYHQLYRLDGELIAVAVLDILPSCVSSVYFMYDDDWEEFSLGKLSALREIALAAELYQAGAPDLSFLYLGFYIHSCQKMRYKGDYQPSFLCDPESYEWYPLEKYTPLLNENRYACFSQPDHSVKGPPDEEIEREFKRYTPQEPDPEKIENILVVAGIKDSQVSVQPITNSPLWTVDELKEEFLCCFEGLGDKLSKEVIFALS